MEAVYIEFIYGNFCFITIIIIIYVNSNVVLLIKQPYFNWSRPKPSSNDNRGQNNEHNYFQMYNV